jgi:hypothetical protein
VAFPDEEEAALPLTHPAQVIQSSAGSKRAKGRGKIDGMVKARGLWKETFLVNTLNFKNYHTPQGASIYLGDEDSGLLSRFFTALRFVLEFL